MKNREEKIRQENANIRRLQLLIDLQLQSMRIANRLTLREGLQYIDNARKFAIALFPGKELAFDLIYKPRFIRVLQERGLFKAITN